MTTYTLWNSKEKKALEYGHIGMWTTDSKFEAEEALGDLFQYLEAIGMSNSKEHISIKDVEEIKKAT